MPPAHLDAPPQRPPAPHHHIRSQFFFFAVTDSPLLSRSLRSHLSRCSVPVSFFFFFLLPLRQETLAMLSLGSALAAVLWQKTLERACLEEDSEGKRALMGGDESLCHVCGWQLAQPSSSHTEETSVRDGQKKGRKCSPDWDGIAKS